MPQSSRKLLATIVCALILLLAGCASAPEADPTATARTIPPTTAASNSTPTPSPNAEPLVPLPEYFTSELLREGVEPSAYLTDMCEYLGRRWDPENSPPGTVVAPVMFHGIVPSGEAPGDPVHINLDTFYAIIALAQELGFETITSEELLGFMLRNEAIPPRSMILILDDRRPGTAEEYFLPVNEENGWTTTLAWPIGDTDERTGLWERIEAINETGYFDVQSHGLKHNLYLSETLPEEEVRQEIAGSIPILEEHFGETPIVYVWPNGYFTETGIRVARESGFELGFTVYSRGPLQFNWVPQGAEEQAYGDPLMTLPRFWSSAALLNLPQAADIGDAARAFAIENYAAEAQWFAANCGGELPELSAMFPED